jgi:hypothetical protein
MLRSGTKKGQVKKENKPQHTREMEEYTMNERILMKLAEAQKKRGFKQKLKDNAWTVGLGVGASAPSVGFAIDQQRRNIKKEKATGEKPKSLIERRPGVVSGAITGGVVSPLLRTVMRGSRGGNTSLGQLASEMVTGAAGGALGGALIVDPLTRWGARKYYQHRDKEIERAIRNRTQGSPLQKTAAYEPQHTREMEEYTMNERVLMKLAEDEKRRKLTESQKRVLTSAALSGLTAPLGFTMGTVRIGGKVHPGKLALVSGLGALTGAGSQALAEKIRERKFQKEAAYGDFVRNLGRNYERTAGRVAHKYAPAITTGAIGKPTHRCPTAYPLGAAGALAGGIAAARAIKNKRQGQEKTASYYAARELLGLQKEASLTLAGSQSIKKTPAKDQILKMIRDLAKKK